MASLADIPIIFINCDRQQDFLIWLSNLPVDSLTKKEILFLWADAANCPVTLTDLAFLGIEGLSNVVPD